MWSFPERINAQWDKDNAVWRHMKTFTFRQQQSYEVVGDNAMPEGGLNYVAHKPLETSYQNRCVLSKESLPFINTIIIIFCFVFLKA